MGYTKCCIIKNYAAGSAAAQQNPWASGRSGLILPAIAVLTDHHEVGPEDERERAQRSLDLPKLHSEVSCRSAYMEAENGGNIEPHPPQLSLFPGAQMTGQGEGSLLGVVGGKDGGADVSLRSGERAPLDAHGKENGVKSGDSRCFCREKRQYNGAERIHRWADPPHIPAE